MKKAILLGFCLLCLLRVGAVPTLKSVNPANGATNVGVTGAFVLQFTENMQVGSVPCQIDGEDLTPVVMSKVVRINYVGLLFNREYDLVVPKGALQNLAGEDYEGITIHFTTKERPQVSMRGFDYIVDPRATSVSSTVGRTINQAFAAAGDNKTKRFLVFVKNGEYPEAANCGATKQNITLVGENRDSVIIYGMGNPTMMVNGAGLYMENLTIKATNDPDYIQYNRAIEINGDKSILKNVRLLGHQDTESTFADRHYFQGCEVHGTIDFMYGKGDVLFDECYIYLEKRNRMMLTTDTWDTCCVIAAGAQEGYQQWGLVFNHCTIDGDPSNDGNYSLGRPWHASCRAVYLNTVMKIKPFDFGWTSMGNPPTLYAEYGSVDSDGQPIDLSRRHNRYIYNDDTVTCAFNPVLTAEEASRYTYKNIMMGTDGWDPKQYCQAEAVPLPRIEGSELVWEPVPYALCYLVRQNGRYWCHTTDCRLSLPAYGTYSVQSVNEYGFTSDQAETEYRDPAALRPLEKAELFTIDGALLSWKSGKGQVQVYDLCGCRLLQTAINRGETLALPQGTILLVKGVSAEGVYIQKVQVLS